MKAKTCIFIFCLVIAFLSSTASLPRVTDAEHQPNTNKCIPRAPATPDSGHSATENDRLAFESIISVHNTYFIVFIGALSVYFGIAGACWRFAFATDQEPHLPKLVQILLLLIPILAGFALLKGMKYGLGICAKHQCSINNLAVRLDIRSIDLSLLPSSVTVSMYVIGILSLFSLILCLYVYWKDEGTNKQESKGQQGC